MKTNETVAEIISETKVDIDYGNGVLLDLSGKQVVGIFDRIEAAHKREVAELVAALKALAADACGHCDARYCQNDGEQEHMPCRVVYEAQALVRKYSPPENETTQESDDGMPF